MERERERWDGLLSADAYLPPLTTEGAYPAPWPLRWQKIAEMDPGPCSQLGNKAP